MSVTERVDPTRAWLVVAAVVSGALLLGSVFVPRLVYDRFVWQYFWGPVYADANGALCAVKTDSSTELLSSQSACAAAESEGIVAYIGYTLVSEVGYAVTLLFALVGVILLLRVLDVGRSRGFFYALLPYMFLGGALRVVEDANDAAPTEFIDYPLNTLLISPVIYVTMFVFALVALLVSVGLQYSGSTERYQRPLAAIGAVALAANVGYLLWLAATTDFVGFYPQIPTAVLLGATLVTGGVWYGIERYRPGINRGTGTMGIVVVWAHAVDGVANVVGIDWGAELGLPYGDLVPKHPVNRALIGVGERFPEAVQNLVGVSWPFLVVKVLAALFILSVFDETIFEESPRYAILLMVAVVAVGLGPGTRDMLRATFGI